MSVIDKKWQDIINFNISENIDTITLSFNPRVVNASRWNNLNRSNQAFNFRIKRTEYCTFYYCDFQAELFDKHQNYKMQLAKIIVEDIIENDYLHKLCVFDCINEAHEWEDLYPFDSENKLERQKKLIWKLYNKLDLIATLVELDFCFDFREEDIDMDVSKRQFLTTVYSNDHGNKHSHWCCYDRREALKSQNQINHQKIDSMPFPIRVEKRFSIYNCDCLFFVNLDKNYDMIFDNFKNVIAKSYRKYAAKREVYRPKKTPYNPNFSSILSVLEEFEKIPLSEELVTKRNAIEKVDVKKLDSATQESIREINSELEKEGYLPIEKMFVPMWKLKRTKKQDSTTEIGEEINNDEYFYSILLSRYQVPEFKIQYGTVDNECYFTSDYNFHLPDFKESE